MYAGTGRISEVFLEDGDRYARLSCSNKLIPGPGQYLLAGDDSSSLLPVPIFYTDSVPRGFIGLAPESWKPGDLIQVRGPIGHGFSLPASARKVALVAWDGTPSRLRGLVRPALNNNASVVFLGESTVDHLPDDVEVLSLSVLEEILQWADYIALDVGRENLGSVKKRMGHWNHTSILNDVQILIHASMPCGGVAECGVCAVTTQAEWKMICRDGPVFRWMEI